MSAADRSAGDPHTDGAETMTVALYHDHGLAIHSHHFARELVPTPRP
jgi:hypothetical protein